MADAMSYTAEELKKVGLGKKFIQKTELLLEETLVMFNEHANENASLTVKIKRFFGDLQVVVYMQGEEFNPYEGAEGFSLSVEDDVDAGSIRSVLLKSHGDKYKYSRSGQFNVVQIQAGVSERNMLPFSIAALVLGLLVGFLMVRFLPEKTTNAVNTSVLTPIKTMFLNALKIIIAPVVFFSLVTCISQFESLAELGRVSVKVVLMYLLTTIIAVSISIGMCYIAKPGEYGFMLEIKDISEKVNLSGDINVSVRDMIVNIVPSNFLRPFIESDTLQIIFLAVIFGLALGMIGQHAKIIRNLFEAMNSLFLAITTLITRFIPLMVFVSMIIMVVEAGRKSFKSLFSIGIIQSLTIMCMIMIYGLLILVLARLNPFKFYKKNAEGMVTSFTLCSSNAAMPTNVRICTEKLGIAPKLANFSIPLGATINMDGACIFLTIISLSVARGCGIDVPVSALVSMAVTVIMLSLGAPGVPGATFLCLAVTFGILHVPVETMGIVLPLVPVLDMFDTMSNTTGDVAAAVIVAKSENMLDLETYNK